MKRSRVIWRLRLTFLPESIHSDLHRPTPAARVSTTDASRLCQPIPVTSCRFRKVVAIRRSRNSASSAAETGLRRRSIWSTASPTLPRPAQDSGIAEVNFRAETRPHFSRRFLQSVSQTVAIQVKNLLMIFYYTKSRLGLSMFAWFISDGVPTSKILTLKIHKY